MSWDLSMWATDRRVLRGLAFLGRLVRRRREQRGMSQRYLEHLSGVDQTIISRLENGKLYGLRWTRFARIVEALDGLDVSLPVQEPPPWPEHATGGPPDPTALHALLERQMAHLAERADD